jgi:SAM-dependent methyltransferase
MDEDTGAFWETHARHDPLWAILSDPTKRGRKWELAQFFETGRREVSVLLERIQDIGVVVPRQLALDFGSGVGRLTQALGCHFEMAIGVDISPTMVRLADKLNRRPKTVRYVLNTRGDLKIFETDHFDFVYSDIVLQHMRPDAIVAYLREFMRVLRPGGLLVFQLPSHRRDTIPTQSACVPMPQDAYKALIEVKNGNRPFMQPSEAAALIIIVHNASGYTWSRAESGVLRVGNHWLRGNGHEMLIQDDGRAELPSVMLPGEVREVCLQITAPRRAQRYTCQVDVVHEGVTWFGDRGSPMAGFEVVVGNAEREQSPHLTIAGDESESYPDIYEDLEPGDEPPAFPMFGLPFDNVATLVASGGAEIILIENDERAGPEWVGYRYFARKRAQR